MYWLTYCRYCCWYHWWYAATCSLTGGGGCEYKACRLTGNCPADGVGVGEGVVEILLSPAEEELAPTTFRRLEGIKIKIVECGDK